MTMVWVSCMLGDDAEERSLGCFVALFQAERDLFWHDMIILCSASFVVRIFIYRVLNGQRFINKQASSTLISHEATQSALMPTQDM